MALITASLKAISFHNFLSTLSFAEIVVIVLFSISNLSKTDLVAFINEQ